MARAIEIAQPLVVKIGGGLLAAHGPDGLRRACADAQAMAASRPVLVVPGGGPFADAVRALELDDSAAHLRALQAMDQLGGMLAGMLPDAEQIKRLVAPRALGLLHAASAFKGHPQIPESWDVTSDSLAVFAAAAIGAEQAVLLKPVNALLPPELTAAQLRALQSNAVDRYLPQAVSATGVTVLIRTPGEPAGSLITP